MNYNINMNMNKLKKIIASIRIVQIILNYRKVAIRISTYSRISVFRRSKMIFLFGSPYHSNMGDQAQTVCILKWLNMNYPDYSVLVFRLPDSNDSLLSYIRRHIRKDDKIICHSGYHMTDLYHEQDVYCKLVQLFKDRPIWIFPQTVHYKQECNLKQTADIISGHGRVTLMARDEISFDTAKKYFTGCKLMLFPDIVTSLIGTLNFDHQRDGVLFCIRNDVEAFYSKKQITALKESFTDIKVEETDTTLPLPYSEIAKDREGVLLGQLDYYSHFKLIITDRYHGTIFSLIAGTPVIVLKTSDHKLSSGVKWFPEEFKDYVYFAENIDTVHDIAKNILGKKLTHKLPPYFKENYYDKLKSLLEDERN